ncbi:hypothetical protein SGPA1_90032 [Streptomyces misionensis JCM 4497]
MRHRRGPGGRRGRHPLGAGDPRRLPGRDRRGFRPGGQGPAGQGPAPDPPRPRHHAHVLGLGLSDQPQVAGEAGHRLAPARGARLTNRRGAFPRRHPGRLTTGTACTRPCSRCPRR